MRKEFWYVLIAVASLAVILIIGYFVTSNKEIKQRELVLNQQKVCEANFDKMYKVIAQVAEVADVKMEESKEAFKEIYPELISGRYENDNASLMKWIQESNPQFDIANAASLYDKLAIAIESNREQFFVEQKKLQSYKTEHNNILKTFPGSFYLDRDTIEIVIITSDYTEKIYNSGKEENINIFNN
jgi:ABC-type Na+ efflux pump permease subunit